MRLFFPQEIIFCPTSKCNLSCAHCNNPDRDDKLSVSEAKKFLVNCKKIGISKIGFSGGEPFLNLSFLVQVSCQVLRLGLTFGRIVTNACWHKNKKDLIACLKKLKDSGYDGQISLSIDSFHAQGSKKISEFITCFQLVWQTIRPLSIFSVLGKDNRATLKMLDQLALTLNGKLITRHSKPTALKTPKGFIKVYPAALSAATGTSLIDPWDNKLPNLDHCYSMNNIFFVLADGTVKPCCGLANLIPELTIGNIGRDSAQKLIINAYKNRFFFRLFSQDLLLKSTKRSSDICFLCRYLSKKHSA